MSKCKVTPQHFILHTPIRQENPESWKVDEQLLSIPPCGSLPVTALQHTFWLKGRSPSLASKQATAPCTAASHSVQLGSDCFYRSYIPGQLHTSAQPELSKCQHLMPGLVALTCCQWSSRYGTPQNTCWSCWPRSYRVAVSIY